MSTAANLDVVRRFEDEFKNNENHDIVDDLMAEDFVHHAPFPGLPPGPEGMKAVGQFVVGPSRTFRSRSTTSSPKTISSPTESAPAAPAAITANPSRGPKTTSTSSQTAESWSGGQKAAQRWAESASDSGCASDEANRGDVQRRRPQRDLSARMIPSYPRAGERDANALTAWIATNAANRAPGPNQETRTQHDVSDASGV